jgi:hypothetical protein
VAVVEGGDERDARGLGVDPGEGLDDEITDAPLLVGARGLGEVADGRGIGEGLEAIDEVRVDVDLPGRGGGADEELRRLLRALGGGGADRAAGALDVALLEGGLEVAAGGAEARLVGPRRRGAEDQDEGEGGGPEGQNDSSRARMSFSCAATNSRSCFRSARRWIARLTMSFVSFTAR